MLLTLINYNIRISKLLINLNTIIMLKSPKLFLAAMLGAMCILSCQKDTIINEPDNQTQLGRQLENPYSVQNMKRAWSNLQGNNDSYRMMGDSIVTTHLYLKFKPQNEDELSLLQQDSTLMTYPYPLDYEIPEGLDHYHDPEIIDSLPTYQYCAVPVDKNLPAVAYEVLEELFVPDEDSDEQGDQRRFISEEVTYALVDEALRITGNLEPEEDYQNQRMAAKWRPKGKITVWDDEMNKYIGVHGVKVRARRWFTTRTGIADAEGNYSCNGKFRRKANYSIKWKRYDFTIRKGHSGACYNGSKKKGNWNLNIKGGRQEYYATIFRAAHHYYYKYINGLRKPPQNSVWHTKLKIRANYEENSEGNYYINGNHNPARRFLGIGSAINIYNPDRNSMHLYSTVIHEIAHASHWNMDVLAYFTSDDIVAESWAKGVQWQLTRMIYPGYYAQYFENYTGVVQDMIDERSGHDQVSGYTIRQIEDALDGESSWNGWKTNIKNSYDNETEEKLDDLFSYWN